MIFRCPLAELMVVVDHKLYCKFLTYDSKRVAPLYVKMNKALYGFLKSELLFYKKLVEDLEAYVSNNIINGNQLAPWVATTVAWPVPAPVARGPHGPPNHCY